MRFRSPRPRSPRRGVTLVEMLVAVALLVLMMTIIVTIFSAATGAMSGLQTYQQLDSDLRQLDITIRQDLMNTTAPMTPPVDPRKNRGYFEYIENAFADLQGEDTDDCLRFTVKAPEGQVFVGKMWLSISPTSTSLAPQPVVTTSQFAEVIYFLRNGNLYRRVLLIAPEKQEAANRVTTAITDLSTFQPANLGGLSTSWQGVNDLSAHPSPAGLGSSVALLHPIILNTLGDTTNRENRFGAPRFANDYVDNTTGKLPPDGIPDDLNGDSVPDYWPTLYFGVPQLASSPNRLIFEVSDPRSVEKTDSMAFPYLYPGMYSKPDVKFGSSTTGAGWIHSTDPSTGFTSYLEQLLSINHSPIPPGGGVDSLPPPTGAQTWWGFPTWRETLSPAWNDPYTLVSNNSPAANNGIQPNGLHPFVASAVPLVTNANFLPPMTPAYRANPQLLADGAGETATGVSTFASSALSSVAWEDDLIMTGVRSFDVKAYDDAFPGYVDLGWGDDTRLHPNTTLAKPNLTQGNGPLLIFPPDRTTNPYPDPLFWNGRSYDLMSTFAHEGRIPPLTTDYRLDAQYPFLNGIANNVGDDSTDVQRLRRVWDTWSTDYTNAPATGLNPTTKLPIGPPWGKPVFPSYPPPYPAPMRAIQIQIRVVDPRNERIKVLTIRQDFTDKL